MSKLIAYGEEARKALQREGGRFRFRSVLLHDGQNVALPNDGVLFPVHLDFGAGVLAGDDLLTAEKRTVKGPRREQGETAGRGEPPVGVL